MSSGGKVQVLRDSQQLKQNGSGALFGVWIVVLYFLIVCKVVLFLKFVGYEDFDCNVRSYYFNSLNVVLVEQTEPTGGQLEILYRKYNSCDTYVPFHFQN